MSSVIVAGDTSGSVTLQAPAVSGSTVLTLPAVSGTLISSGGAASFTDLTTTGNTILGNASTDTLNVGNGGLVKDASGNVGIGVTPNTWSAGYNNIQFGSVSSLGTFNSANITQLRNNAYESSGWKYIAAAKATMYQQDTGAHSWYTAGTGTVGGALSWTTAMTLDASGNLGIGTTSPLNPLQVHSSANTAVRVSTGGGISQFRGYVIGNTASDTNEYGSLKMEINGGELRLTAGYATWGGVQTFYTNGVERMRIPSTGGIQSVNCVSVGNATPSASGAGITFPATQSASTNANTLDDYEEGTWTPLLNGAVSLGTATYIKIGKFVTCQISAYNITISSIGLGTNLFLTGFPFAINAYAYHMPCAQQANINYGLFDGNGTNWNMGVGGSALDFQAVTRTTFGSTAAMSFRFRFMYESTD
jgi:hypothetical protein